jgi:hypothetical protein
MPPMMSLSSHTFWIDYESGKLLESFTSGAQAKNPIFIQGDTAKVEVHLLRRNGSNREEISIPAGATLKMGIGRLESQPTAGTFKIGYKGIASAEIPFNASASALETALNGIPDVDTEGGISVETAGDAFLLTWNSGNTHDPLTSDPDELFPSSQVILVGQVVGDVQKVLLHLQQSPVAFLQTFTAMGNPVITSTLLATIGSKKVYRISIAPNPAGGSFYISGTNNTGTLESPGISVNATSTDVLNALPATIQTDASVIKSGTYSWDISISSANSLTADGSGLIGWLGVEGLLSLNTVQIHEFLNARESAPAVLEVMVSESTGETTILQTPCTIVADLIDEGSIAPLDLTPPLSEGVANSRYVRRDTWQNPSGSEINNVWLNLGVSKIGTDVAESISNANQPSAGNPFATISDIPTQLPTEWGQITGSILDQSDLAGELSLLSSTKYDSSNPAGYIGSSALSDYARLDGSDFIGRVNLQGDVSYAPLGISPYSQDPSNLSNGDVWFNHQQGRMAYYYAQQSGSGVRYVATTTDLSNYYQSSNPAGFITSSALAPYAPLSGATFSGQVNIGSMALNAARTEIQTSSIGATISMTKGGSQQSVLSIGEAFGNVPFLYLSGSTGEATIHGGRFYSGGLSTGVEPYARIDGATFSGKANFTSVSGAAGLNIGIGGVSTSTITPGDLWISTGGVNLNFRDANGSWRVCATTTNGNVFNASQSIDTTSTTPALRVTQKGTGFAIRIEDETTPDTSATIIDNSGKMGIQINPASITLTEALTVGGNVLASNFKCNPGSGSAFYFQSGNYLYDVTSGGSNPFTSGSFNHNDYPLEIEIQANGTTYRVPARSL